MTGGFSLQGPLQWIGSGCLECCVEKDSKVLCHDSLVTSARSKAVRGDNDTRTMYTHRLPRAQGTPICGGPDIR